MAPNVALPQAADGSEPVARPPDRAHIGREAGPTRRRFKDRAMTSTSNRLLDDLARLATDAMGAAQGVRREAETVVRAQMERLLRDMDIATREEVEVLRDMIVAAREENERLLARIEALEARLGGAPAPGGATPAQP
jgi:BMFP domain-containing protein YqiC